MSAAPRLASLAVSDAELLEAVAAGDLEALGTIFDRYQLDVRRYLGRLGISREDVDDLVQATFLEVVRAAKRFDPERATRSWLFGIATMMVRRHRRSVSRTLARMAKWASQARDEAPETPAESFESNETGRRFELAFNELSTKKREVFTLVVVEGFSGEEAARALGIPVNTVWTRLHHARRELRSALEGGTG
jgi:RNA polymerase sigma-70 factor (ECF subfamily)